MRKLVLIGLLGLLMLNMAVAEVQSLQTQQIETDVELKQIGADFLSCNITSVSYPNTTVFVEDVLMTKRGTEYNFTISMDNISTLGNYIVNGFCTNGSDDIVWAYDFDVTYNGNKLNTERSILYIGLIAILVFLFLLIVFNIHKLPSGDHVSQEGLILDINNLKYLRPVLWGLAWAVLLGIVFLTSNVSIAYLPNAMFGDFFFTLYRIMFLVTLPMTVVWFIWLFYKLLHDRETKRMIDRGVDIRSTP